MNLPDRIKDIMQVLINNGYEAFLVGGAIRDSLLGNEPKDYDFATNATPDEVEMIFDKTIPTGKEYGTIVAMVDGEGYEITTYRLESDYDGRRPNVVKFADTLKEDLSRRDFTINAMACDITGEVVDYFNGIRDLDNGEICCVGNAKDRLAEDKLRAMRAIRFASRYGFDIHRSIIYELDEINLSLLSKERLRDEFNKIIVSKTPSVYLRFMRDHGILYQIIPELSNCFRFDQQNVHHNKDVFEHIMSVVDATESDLLLRLSALFHDIGKPACFTIGEDGSGHFYGHQKESAKLTREIMGRLKYSNKEIEYVSELVYWHMSRYGNFKTSSIKKLINKVGEGKLDGLFKLQVADICGSKPPFNFENVYRCKFECERILSSEEPLSIKDLEVNGHDMMGLGFKGEKIGDVLKLLLNNVLGNAENNKRKILMNLAKKEL